MDKRLKNNSVDKVYLKHLIFKYGSRVSRYKKQILRYDENHYRYKYYIDKIDVMESVIDDLKKAIKN